jgi:hypothetical protein
LFVCLQVARSDDRNLLQYLASLEWLVLILRDLDPYSTEATYVSPSSSRATSSTDVFDTCSEVERKARTIRAKLSAQNIELGERIAD